MDTMKEPFETALNYYVSEHFLYSDFICPCCDRIRIVPGFYCHLSMLERMTGMLGRPIVITSGYRCADHNRDIGGAPRSWHLLFATDITVEGEDESVLKELYRIAIDLGFGGIGLYETHLHLDMRSDIVHWRG